MPTSTPLTDEQTVEFFKIVENELGIEDDADVELYITSATWVAAEKHGDGSIATTLALTIEAPNGYSFKIDLHIPVDAILRVNGTIDAISEFLRDEGSALVIGDPESATHVHRERA